MIGCRGALWLATVLAIASTGREARAQARGESLPASSPSEVPPADLGPPRWPGPRPLPLRDPAPDTRGHPARPLALPQPRILVTRPHTRAPEPRLAPLGLGSHGPRVLVPGPDDAPFDPRLPVEPRVPSITPLYPLPAPVVLPAPRAPRPPPNTACPTCVGGEGTVPVDGGGLPSLSGPIACPTCFGGAGVVSVLRRGQRTSAMTRSGAAADFEIEIVNGEEVEAPEPAAAPVRERDLFEDVVAVAAGDRVHCSGVAVGSRHVLTARHCLPATRVVVGHRIDESFGQARVVRATVHADGLDVALLELDRDVVVAARARRITDQPPRGVIRLVGFGVDDFARMTGFGVKRRVDVTITDWGCDPRRARRIGCERGREMVVPHSRGRDTCAGDSGGAVFEATTSGWRLLAITSRSIGGNDQQCGDGGIYVRVDALRTWIEGSILEGGRS